MAFWVCAAAASQVAMAFCASAEASTSMPFRNGSSASPVFWTSASAFSTFSTACEMSSAHKSRSFCSLAALTTADSFFSAAVMRVLMPASSSFRKPLAFLSFTSTSFAVALSLFCAEVVAFSILSTASAEGWSSASGAAAVATFSTSPSAACSRMATSLSICLTRMRSSASLVMFRSFATSCWMPFTRVCSLPSSEPEPAPEIASFFSSAVFWSRHFRATTMLACAARSARLACSTTSAAPSAMTSPAPPMPPSDCVASVSLSTSVSAAETLASTSSSKWPRLRSAVADLNCCSRSRPSSRRFCSMSISSLTVFAGPSEKRATSMSFRATKVWASARAVCTRWETLSASAITTSMSCSFSPRRNGSSASAIFCSSSSAVLTRSETSFSRVSAAILIWVSLTVLRTSSSFS
mmetsp:Transcript_67806/g.192187  ORF Transcript_67806/g.192187 Transcript_67806/m.192187 type:complete len:410 (-) Transcript_67806:1678-2907(-)